MLSLFVNVRTWSTSFPPLESVHQRWIWWAKRSEVGCSLRCLLMMCTQVLLVFGGKSFSRFYILTTTRRCNFYSCRRLTSFVYGVFLTYCSFTTSYITQWTLKTKCTKIKWNYCTNFVSVNHHHQVPCQEVHSSSQPATIFPFISEQPWLAACACERMQPCAKIQANINFIRRIDEGTSTIASLILFVSGSSIYFETF